MEQGSFSPTICLVEDETILRKEMAFQLRHRGLRVETFGSATELFPFLASHTDTIVVLDIGLAGGEDGVSICRTLRAHDPQMGIVFVTARGLRDERLMGLAAGADGYFVKPVDIDELTLVLLRLIQRHATRPETPSADAGVPARSWSIDVESLALISPDGSRVGLTLNEFQLMRVLSREPGQTCTPAKLCRALDLQVEDWNNHRIEVIISRLRKKVERQSGAGLPVRNLRGQGYVWVGHSDQRSPRTLAADPVDD